MRREPGARCVRSGRAPRLPGGIVLFQEGIGVLGRDLEHARAKIGLTRGVQTADESHGSAPSTIRCRVACALLREWLSAMEFWMDQRLTGARQ